MMYVQNIISKGMLNMEMKMDLNSLVKVKLTDFGVSVLRMRHEEHKIAMYKIGINLEDFKFELKLDEDGYYKSSMKFLMEVFGEHMRRGKVSSDVTYSVFESEIIVLDATPVSE